MHGLESFRDKWMEEVNYTADASPDLALPPLSLSLSSLLSASSTLYSSYIVWTASETEEAIWLTQEQEECYKL